MVIERLLPRLAALPGLEAVALGGSRAVGTARPGSDWDFGLYYRGRFDTASLRQLGLPGHVSKAGEWGRLMNGGAWLRFGHEPVDLLLRDLDAVEQWRREAEHGRFEVDNLEGHAAGVPTYLLLAEVASNRVLWGRLPEVRFPARLRETAPARWRWVAAFSLVHAAAHADRDDRAACAGMLGRASLQAAHAVLAARGEWVLNEKGLLGRAGLQQVGEAIKLIAEPRVAVTEVERLLALSAPQELRRGR